MPDDKAVQSARKVVDHCTRCGHCRELMSGSSCVFFPRLYKLVDREAGGGEAISPDELKQLFELCNTCGICPCAPVHTWIRDAKDAFVERDGLPLGTRLLENVRLVGRLGTTFTRLSNLMMGDNLAGRALKGALGLHQDRKLPRFPRQSFDVWAKAQGLKRKPETKGRKVAYFVGCTARYMFPEVAKATVEVLQKNGVEVYVPEQKCCGMPTMQEGDRPFTFDLARFNIDELSRCVDAGFDIVTACPTCGYMLKTLLRESAEYSQEYIDLVKRMTEEAGGNLSRVSERLEREDKAFTGHANRRAGHGKQAWLLNLMGWKVFRDLGYFAELGGLKRLRVANHSYDLGEYLLELHEEGALNLDFGPVDAKRAYFSSCHQRHQNIGEPWVKLLGLLPGAKPAKVGDAFDCCGLAGVMGYKKGFHKTSIAIGTRLANKVRAAAPEEVTTECLSCQMQFQQMLPYEVSHPVEILREAYRKGR